MTSLLHPYVQEQTNTIAKCLHDDGRLGSITKYMLMQTQNLGMVPGVCAWQDSRYCSIARKLAFMQEAEIDLAGPMEILLAGNPIHTFLNRCRCSSRESTPARCTESQVPYIPYMNWESGTSAGLQMVLAGTRLTQSLID